MLNEIGLDRQHFRFVNVNYIHCLHLWQFWEFRSVYLIYV